MKQNLREAFKGIKKFDVSIEIKENIMHRIKKDESKRAQGWFFASALFSIGSLTAVILSVVKLSGSLVNSGFWSMFSLTFSDPTVVAEHPNYFLASLLENFPLVSTLCILISFLALFISFNLFFELFRGMNSKYNTWCS